MSAEALARSEAMFLFDVLQRKPWEFIECALECHSLEDYQKKLLVDLVSYDRIAIKSCHATGKTFSVARIVLWFLYCFPYSKVITTAPTYRQVKDLLWGEIHSALSNSKMLFDGNKNLTEIKINPDWFAIGFVPKREVGDTKEQKGSTFQGYHSRYILVVFDEATGIDQDVYVMAEGLLTSGEVVKWVCIGNPTVRSSNFFKLFSKPDWHGVKWDCFKSPNLIANDLTNKQKIREELTYLAKLTKEEKLKHIANYKKPNPYLLSAQWVMSKILEWGMEHPLTLSKIFAEFPLSDDTVLVKFESVQASLDRVIDVDKTKTRFIGIDVARGGPDKTVFNELIGYKNTRIQKHKKKDGHEVASELMLFCNEDKVSDTVLILDGTGVGSSVEDQVKKDIYDDKYFGNVKLVVVHSAQSPSHDDKDEDQKSKKLFKNAKGQMFYLLNQDLRDNIDLLTDEETYEEQLPEIKFKFDNQEKILIESKDDYKSRTGKSSPDEADSLALANYGRYIFRKAGNFGTHSTSETVFRNQLDNSPIRKRTRLKINEY